MARTALGRRVEKLEASRGSTACTLEGLIAESYREWTCDDVDAEDEAAHLAQCWLCRMIVSTTRRLQ